MTVVMMIIRVVVEAGSYCHGATQQIQSQTMHFQKDSLTFNGCESQHFFFSNWSLICLNADLLNVFLKYFYKGEITQNTDFGSVNVWQLTIKV